MGGVRFLVFHERLAGFARGRVNTWAAVVVALTVLLPVIPSQAKVYRHVKDQLGRRIMLPETPIRVIALAPSITEIVFALGCEDRLKGATQFSDFPPAACLLPKVGSYVRPDLEKIVALNPDLCIATKDGNPPELVSRLDALKIPVYVVDPRNLNEVIRTVEDIGNLLNVRSHAETLAEKMRRRIKHVREMVSRTRSRPKVLVQIGVAPMVSAGSNTFIDELIRTAGGRNIAAGTVTYPRLTREEILAAKPDVIIITSMARGEVFEKVKSEWMQWPMIPAVRNKRIHIVDSNLFDRPTPRLVKGLEILARLIHPELFKGQR